MDASLKKCNSLGAETEDKAAAVYASAVSAVLAKHQGTLKQIETLEQGGRAGQARRLFRSSGLLEDLVQALAKAGRDSGALVRQMRADILEVMADDDGGETG